MQPEKTILEYSLTIPSEHRPQFFLTVGSMGRGARLGDGWPIQELDEAYQKSLQVSLTGKQVIAQSLRFQPSNN